MKHETGGGDWDFHAELPEFWGLNCRVLQMYLVILYAHNSLAAFTQLI